MKKYFLVFLVIIFLTDVHAQAIRSCDGDYSARIVGHDEIVVEHAAIKIGSSKIDHGIAGGVFESMGKWLVVYGLPIKVDVQSPQSEHLSIFFVRPRLKKIMEIKYGGGVYDVSVGTDPNLIFVSTRFRFDVVNIKTREVKSFDPMSEPQFSKQDCKND